MSQKQAKKLRKLAQQLEPQIETKPTKKLPVKRLLATGVAIAAYTLWYFATNNQITYEQARNNQSLQEQFIENLENKLDLPSYVTDIKYNEEKFKEGAIPGRETSAKSATIADGPIKYFGNGASSEITFTRESFNYANAIQFMIGVDHELNMAKIFYEGFDIVPRDVFKFQRNQEKRWSKTTFKLVAELESYDKDLKRSIKNNLSDRFVKSLKQGYINYYLPLWQKEMPLSMETRSNLITLFFRPWMKDQDYYKQDEVGEFIEHKKTKFYLPK